MENDNSEKSLIKYLSELKTKAVEEHNSKFLKKLKRYYYGSFSSEEVNIKNYFNIIKPIVETKATLVLDSMISTSVRPKLMSQIDFKDIDKFQKIAEILDESLSHVKNKNKFDKIKQKLVMSALAWKSGILKLGWDPEMDDGAGEIEISNIDILDFFPDPSGKSIPSCNYIFVRRRESLFSLRKQYENNPEALKKINDLAKTGEDTSDKDVEQQDVEPIGIKAMKANNKTDLAYVYPSDGIKKAIQDIEIWECYIKDDSIFIDGDEDSKEEKEVKNKERLKFPHGRVIIFSKDYVLEDKAIEYPFGFPFCIFNAHDGEGLFGKSETEDLLELQDRINRAYYKLKMILGAHVDKVIIDRVSSGVSKDQFTNANVLEVTNPAALDSFRHFSTQQLDQITYLFNVIDSVKNDAKETARVNDMMISGSRPQGVTSGDMVNDLLESPMSSIREIQRSFKEFLVEVAEKIVTLIQLFYTNSRIVRISSGKYALIPQRQSLPIDPNSGLPSSDQESLITIEQEIEGQDGKFETVEEIKGDLSLGKYEVSVTAGTDLPRSKSQIADMTIKLVQNGVLGDVNDIEVKELILDTLDYPNRRAIINRIKERTKEASELPQAPQFDNFIEKVNVSAKDIIEMADRIEDPRTKNEIFTNLLGELGLIEEAPEVEAPIPPQALPVSGDQENIIDIGQLNI